MSSLPTLHDQIGGGHVQQHDMMDLIPSTPPGPPSEIDEELALPENGAPSAKRRRYNLAANFITPDEATGKAIPSDDASPPASPASPAVAAFEFKHKRRSARLAANDNNDSEVNDGEVKDGEAKDTASPVPSGSRIVFRQTTLPWSNLPWSNNTGSVKVAPAKKTRSAKKTSSANTLSRISVQDGKPEPVGQPSVWSDRRQGLCETLPAYRAYQSGAYTRQGMVYGQMVNEEASDLDYLDHEVLVTRLGGGRVKNSATGKMVSNADQKHTVITDAYKHSIVVQQKVLVIVGQGYAKSPSKMPHYYNILDWFHVTDMWCDKSTGYVQYLVRFEKVNLTAQSWWAPVGSDAHHPSGNGGSVQVLSHECIDCNEMHKMVYDQGWACLNRDCKLFFDFGPDVDVATLTLSDAFLKERTAYNGAAVGPLAPPLLTMEDVAAQDGSGYEDKCSKGIVCPKCGCCSRRIAWKQWACENSTCDFVYALEMKEVAADTILIQDTTKIPGALRSKNHPEFFNGGIQHVRKMLGLPSADGYLVEKYVIPGLMPEKPAGVVVHFKANAVINSLANGPDKMFVSMQRGDFGLKRKPARQGGYPGEVLTDHWATNWGAPYKYGVVVDSKAFDDADPVIIKALKRLTWAGKHATKLSAVVFESSFQPFNELLSLGYFEDHKIGYHDDGEKELGPTVATLSLGGAAHMTIRPKRRSPIGGVKTGSSKAYKPDVLQMVLNHGDLVVMHGEDIQKDYEHAVTPFGGLRFALTSRYIIPERIPIRERAEAMRKGTIPNIGWEYNGPEDLHDWPAPVVPHVPVITLAPVVPN